MSNLNIDPESTDMFNRYTFPSPVLLHTKSSTCIKNACSISTALRRDLPIISKYFSLELGVSSRVEEKMIILKGKFSEEEVIKKIYKFIENYVLCNECRNPETVPEEEKMKCLACGFRKSLKKDKISSLILKMKGKGMEYEKI